MLQLLHPIWLIAMAGIALPVIIHLWNNKQGKVFPVGSIAFLEKSPLRQARTRRLSEWLLLSLRCGLFLLLALLLAGPFWRHPVDRRTTKGWVLGMPEGVAAKTNKPLIDSLLKTGYEWHTWDSAVQPSYWRLFQAADREAPAGIPFYIFTSGMRWHFTGARPISSREVHWITDTVSGGDASSWIARAWRCTPDSICVLTGSSRSTGTIYKSQQLPAKTGTYPGAGTLLNSGTYPGPGIPRIGFANGRWSVTLDSQPPVIVDTAPLRIQIYADNKYNNDCRYVAAALHALQQFTRYDMQVTVSMLPAPSATHPNTTNPDWIYWLSSTPVPDGLAAPNILRYESGKEIAVDTWMQEVNDVMISRRIQPDTLQERTRTYADIWKDGFGRSFLSMDSISGKRVFHFFSHFDPAWNDLVWSRHFPVLLEQLLMDQGSAAGPSITTDPAFAPTRGASIGLADPSSSYDRRLLDPEQIMPQRITGPDNDLEKREPSSASFTTEVPFATGVPAASATTDLAPACWLMIFLLFLAERIIAFRSPETTSNG